LLEYEKLKHVFNPYVQRILAGDCVLGLINESILVATEEGSGRDGGGGEKGEEESSDPHVGKPQAARRNGGSSEQTKPSLNEVVRMAAVDVQCRVWKF
jgi:hypothetical protein